MESQLNFTDKLTNIFISPSEVFEDVVTSEPKTSNYWIPVLISIFIGIIFTFTVFSDVSIQNQINSLTETRIAQQVEAGKMTQEQADSALENNPAKAGSPMFLIFGSVGVIFFTIISLYGISLATWLCGKIFYKSEATYGKNCEVVGTSMYILAVGGLITILTIFGGSSIYATPSLAFFITEYDTTNKLHLLASSIDFTTIWFNTVLSIGIGKLFKTAFVNGFITIFILWGIYVAAKIFMSAGFAATA